MAEADDEPSCQRCGGPLEHVTCDTCGGAGVDGHDCGEDTCCCLDPEENATCTMCDGAGGWLLCFDRCAEPKPQEAR